jgi:hypothetical protein
VTDGPFTEAKEVIWRLRYPPGKLEGRGHRNGQEFPPGSR